VDEYAGTGQGVITGDGSSVELYALLPAYGEAEIIHAAVPPGASILELGCGVCRILRPLAALGHPVTGVDDSSDMLARSPDLPTVCSTIQSLRLERRFDVVLLTGGLMNFNPGTRHEFLTAMRNHLNDDGISVFQQLPMIWFKTFVAAEPIREDPGGIRCVINSARLEPPRMRVELEYQVGDRVWTHAWTAYQISDDELFSDLAAADLCFGDWITNDHAWFTARPA
jgi:SAM-dependent methyltransferase